MEVGEGREAELYPHIPNNALPSHYSLDLRQPPLAIFEHLQLVEGI